MVRGSAKTRRAAYRRTECRGVVRSFSGFAAALDEIKNARVFGGIHFRTACNDGTALGSAIGNYVIHHAPLPKHREREDSRGR